MADPRQRALVSVRAKRIAPSAATTVYCRAHDFAPAKPWSFDPAEPSVTGAEQLLGIVLSEVIELFVGNCRQERLEFDILEATAGATLAGALVWLGVIGAEGEAAYEDFAIKVYLDSSADEQALHTLWQDAVRRSPLLNTLRRAAAVDVSLQIVR